MALKIDVFIIGIILFALALVAGNMIIADVQTNYEIDMGGDEYNDTYVIANRMIDNMSTTADDMESDVLDADISTVDAITGMFKGAFSALRLVRNSFALVLSMIGNLAEVFGIPTIFVSVLVAVILISLIFAIIYLIMVGKR